MRLTVGFEVDENTPNGVLLQRLDIKPPYANAVEEKAVLGFVARLVLADMIEGTARLLEFHKSNGSHK